MDNILDFGKSNQQNQMAGGISPNINVDPIMIKCPECENKTWKHNFVLYKISKIMNPEIGEDKLIPTPVFQCSSCNYILENLDNI